MRKLGIIIICNQNKPPVKTENLDSELVEFKGLEICIVNNNKIDECKQLDHIQKKYSNVSVVNIKKNKPISSAARAGARYLLNHFNLDHLGYLQVYSGSEMISHLNYLELHKDAIIEWKKRVSKNTTNRTSKFQDLISLNDWIQDVDLAPILD